MQGYLVSPASPRCIHGGFGVSGRTSFFLWACNARRNNSRLAAAAATKGEQDHYALLGLSADASPADVKRAYRFLARKYHPDVSKDMHADMVFKRIRLAYEVLSNETARAEYDTKLKFCEDTSRPCSENGTQDLEFNQGCRIYRWEELRQQRRHEKQKQHYNDTEEDSSFSYAETGFYEETLNNERGSFHELMRFTFFILLCVQLLGSRISLTLCGLTALLDKKLDAGYKLGYLIAWVLGGRSGIVLTLCLSFTSWLCGKASSSLVAVVVVAMWVGAHLARFAPLPHGAILTLLYMSIRLQVDLS